MFKTLNIYAQQTVCSEGACTNHLFLNTPLHFIYQIRQVLAIGDNLENKNTTLLVTYTKYN